MQTTSATKEDANEQTWGHISQKRTTWNDDDLFINTIYSCFELLEFSAYMRTMEPLPAEIPETCDESTFLYTLLSSIVVLYVINYEGFGLLRADRYHVSSYRRPHSYLQLFFIPTDKAVDKENCLRRILSSCSEIVVGIEVIRLSCITY